MRARPRIGRVSCTGSTVVLEFAVDRPHLHPGDPIGVVLGTLDQETHGKPRAVELDPADQLHAPDHAHALGGSVQTHARNPSRADSQHTAVIALEIGLTDSGETLDELFQRWLNANYAHTAPRSTPVITTGCCDGNLNPRGGDYEAAVTVTSIPCTAEL